MTEDAFYWRNGMEWDLGHKVIEGRSLCWRLEERSKWGDMCRAFELKRMGEELVVIKCPQ